MLIAKKTGIQRTPWMKRFNSGKAAGCLRKPLERVCGWLISTVRLLCLVLDAGWPPADCLVVNELNLTVAHPAMSMNWVGCCCIGFGHIVFAFRVINAACWLYFNRLRVSVYGTNYDLKRDMNRCVVASCKSSNKGVIKAHGCCGIHTRSHMQNQQSHVLPSTSTGLITGRGCCGIHTAVPLLGPLLK